MRISDWSSDVCSSDLSTSSGRTVLIISVRHNRSSPLHKRRRSGSIAAMQFIDLSIPITNDVVSDPPVMHPNITHMTHENTWEQIAMFFPGLARETLHDGQGWDVQLVSLSTHTGKPGRDA